MELAPDGCFGIDCEGELRATTTAVCFGRELAWIGMVLTEELYRGRGFARRLMEHALAYLRDREVGWIKLDATDMGRTLYERLGFREEGAVERWMRPPGDSARRDTAVCRFEMDGILDREAFGADRSRLLSILAGIESVSIPGTGFAVGRGGARAAYFGPCVARSAEAARQMLAWFLERHAAENVYCDILPANLDAVATAREFGFEPSRRLSRMFVSGVDAAPPLRNNDALVFAAAGFEYG
jgi:GNAT superfamily N-acetyltransferase